MTADRRRAVSLVLLAVVLAVGCSLAGRWQWNRHVARDAVIATIEHNYSASAVPIADLLASPSAALPTDLVWRRVSVTGHYVPDQTVLLRNRPIDGQPGFHVLVPFVTSTGSDGTVLVVDRGWIPMGADAESSGAVPRPPSGTVTVTVHLRQDEPASSRTAPEGQVQAISIAQVLAASAARTGARETNGHPVYAAYGALDQEVPAAQDRVGALPEPSTDPGSHLSYAFQWWTFALGSLVGFGMMALREVRGDGAERPGVNGGPAPRPRRRGPSAEEIEDDLIDAQLDDERRDPGQASEIRSR